ncbi:phage major capsid protein [Streptococcus suis]|nr:phage major capsid protein [Streptococcus suis]
MTLTLTRQKNNFERYIRSQGHITTGMNLLGNQIILEQSLIDSYVDHDKPKELVDLVTTIETLTKGGKYEVNSFETDILEEISQEYAGISNIDKETIQVDYMVKRYSGMIDFSQEQLDDGQYNLSDFLGKQIVKLERNTRNRAIGKVLQMGKHQTASTIDELKSVVSLINPEHTVSMVLSQSLFNVLEKLKDNSGNYLLKIDKATGTTDTFYVNHVLIVDDMTLGGKGDKLAFIGNLEKFVTLFDRKKSTISWYSSQNFFGKRLILNTRFDVQKVDADCGYLVTWN